MTPEFKDGLFREMLADYEARVIPENAGTAQRLGMKQSFLAGSLAYQMAMASAFVNDKEDGNALIRLEMLDAEIASMCAEHMEAATRAQLEELTGIVEPDDAPMKTRVHLVEARGLSIDDVGELNGLIQQFIAERTATRAEH